MTGSVFLGKSLSHSNINPDMDKLLRPLWISAIRTNPSWSKSISSNQCKGYFTASQHWGVPFCSPLLLLAGQTWNHRTGDPVPVGRFLTGLRYGHIATNAQVANAGGREQVISGSSRSLGKWLVMDTCISEQSLLGSLLIGYKRNCIVLCNPSQHLDLATEKS